MQRSLGLVTILGLVAAVLLGLAVACSPKATATPTPAPTNTPTKAATPTATTAAPTATTAAATATPTSVAAPTATPTKAATTAAPSPTPTGGGALPTMTGVAPTPTAAPTVKPAGTLRIAYSPLPADVWDPTKTATGHSLLWQWGVTEVPTMVDDKNQIVPMLAESYSWDSTMTQLTFKLRKGVQFNGGWGEMTSADWEYSLLSQGATGNPRNYALLTDKLADHKAIDTYTYQFVLKVPDPTFFPFFMINETYGSFAIWPKKRADTLGADKMITDTNFGTGPYKLTSYSQGNEAQLTAVAGQWRISPQFASVRIVDMPASATQIAALEANEVDVVGSIPVTVAPKLTQEGFDMRKRSWGGTWDIAVSGQYCFGQGGMQSDWQGKTIPPREAYDPSKYVWEGKCGDQADMQRAAKVKRAMAMALNTESYVKDLLGGYGETMWGPEMVGPLRQVYAAYKDKWKIPYDPAGAKALLAEAGVPNGFEIPFVLPTPVVDPGRAVFDAVIRDLAAIGVTAKAQTMESGPWATVRDSRKFAGLFMKPNSGAVRQPEAVRLRRLPTATFNTGNELPDVLNLILESDKQTDQAKREAMVTQAIQYFVDNQYFIVLFEMNKLYGVNPKVVGAWPMSASSEAAWLGPEYAQRAK